MPRLAHFMRMSGYMAHFMRMSGYRDWMRYMKGARCSGLWYVVSLDLWRDHKEDSQREQQE